MRIHTFLYQVQVSSLSQLLPPCWYAILLLLLSLIPACMYHLGQPFNIDINLDDI